ncbi:transposase, partial [Streptomyces europaeiscabiei]|nr:transposase [Streptomyces europaeiscabiei]
ALNRGRIDAGRLRRTLAALPQPKAADGRLVLAVDVSNWLRPDAECSADRLFCHTYGRSKDQHLMIPGWPYPFVAALASGRTSWCQLLDAVRLGPADDVAEVTAVQVRRVVQDLIAGGRWRPGELDILIVFDAGYDAPRMAHLLHGLPVEVLGRMRSDRVMRRPVPVPWISPPQGGRPPKHGKEFRFAKPESWGEPDTATTQVTDRYGTAQTMAWDRIHPRLTTRSAVSAGCKDRGMPMCDYFSAPNDDAAVGVLDQPGGPDTSGFDVVPFKGIDPSVTMASLEAILTGCTYAEASARPRAGQLLSSPVHESAVIISLSDTLQEVLASASHDGLADAAAAWAETDELQAYGITADIAREVLVLLSGLADRAASGRRRLYCWWAL